MSSPRYLSTKELAARWECSIHALERRRKHGTGPPYVRLLGPRNVRYLLSDIEEWERSNKTRPSPVCDRDCEYCKYDDCVLGR